MRKEVKARARRYAHMAIKYRMMRQFRAAHIKYAQLMGVCCALAAWGDGSFDAGYWFRWMISQANEMGVRV